MRSSSWLVGGLLGVALVYSGASWWAGREAQGVIERTVIQSNERIKQFYGPDVASWRPQITIDHYERGVFSSTVGYQLSVRDDDGRTLQWSLRDEMQHGPFPWRELAAGHWAPQLASSLARLQPSDDARAWFEWSTEPDPLRVHTRVGWQGDGVSTWRFAPVRGRNDQHDLAFDGGTLNVQFSHGFRDAVVTGRFADLRWQVLSSDEDIVMAGFDLTAQTRVDEAGAEHADTRFELARLSLAQEGDVLLQLEGVQTDIQAVQRDGLLDGTIRYAFGQVGVAGYDAGSVSATVRVARLHVAAMTALADTLDAAQRRAGDEDVAGWEDLTADERRHVVDQLVLQLAQGPAVAMDPIQWRNSAGSSEVHLNVKLQPVDAATAGDPAALLSGVERVTLDLDVSRAMVAEVFARTEEGDEGRAQATALGQQWFDQLAAQLQGLSLARLDGDRLQVEVVYEGGVWRAGGQPIPPWLLLPLLMSING